MGGVHDSSDGRLAVAGQTDLRAAFCVTRFGCGSVVARRCERVQQHSSGKQDDRDSAADSQIVPRHIGLRLEHTD